jgi:hypothetical protein
MGTAKTRRPKAKKVVRTLRDCPPNQSLGGVRFKHPLTGQTCIWYSQWGYENGKAGVWYKTDATSSQIFPLFLDKLEQALDFELVEKQ